MQVWDLQHAKVNFKICILPVTKFERLTSWLAAISQYSTQFRCEVTLEFIMWHHIMWITLEVCQYWHSWTFNMGPLHLLLNILNKFLSNINLATALKLKFNYHELTVHILWYSDKDSGLIMNRNSRLGRACHSHLE